MTKTVTMTVMDSVDVIHLPYYLSVIRADVKVAHAEVQLPRHVCRLRHRPVGPLPDLRAGASASKEGVLQPLTIGAPLTHHGPQRAFACVMACGVLGLPAAPAGVLGTVVQEPAEQPDKDHD